MKSTITSLVAAVAVLGACDGNRATIPPPRSNLIASAPDIRLGQPTRACSDRATSQFGGTALADREGWYGDQLRAAREQPLCRLPGDSAPRYRFLWVPSFHGAVVVRIEPGPDGYRLTAKGLGGAGGYEPGGLTREASYELTDEDMQKFAELLAAARFWELPTKPPADGTLGADGAQWVLEGIEKGRYHVVDRWTPQPDGRDAAYRRLGEWLLARSALAPAWLVKEY